MIESDNYITTESDSLPVGSIETIDIDAEADALFERLEQEELPLSTIIGEVAVTETVTGVGKKKHSRPEASDIILFTDAMKNYKQSIGKYPLLTAVQEVEYTMAHEAGVLARERRELHADMLTQAETEELLALQKIGEEAYQTMINSNLRLVFKWTSKFMGKGLDFPELIQEGNLGLMHAAEKFDYTKGYKFSTYAAYWIKQSMQRATQDIGREIRVTVHIIEKIDAVVSTRKALTAEFGRIPTDQEVADELEIPLKRLKELDGYNRMPSVSLNTPLGNGDIEFGELLPDENSLQPEANAETASLLGSLEKLLDTLSEREAKVVRLFYGLYTDTPLGFDEIAKVIGTTTEYTRAIKARAMKKMGLRADGDSELREFL